MNGADRQGTHKGHTGDEGQPPAGWRMSQAVRLHVGIPQHDSRSVSVLVCWVTAIPPSVAESHCDAGDRLVACRGVIRIVTGLLGLRGVLLVDSAFPVSYELASDPSPRPSSLSSRVRLKYKRTSGGLYIF